MPLAVAFAISALLHAAAITMPGWELPGMTDPDPPLEAHLVPPPRPAPHLAAAEKPKPRTPPAKRVAPSVASAVAPAADSSVPQRPEESAVAEVAAPEPVAAAAPLPAELPAAPAAVVPPWPRQGRVHYKVTYGEDGFAIGETLHEWRIDGNRYSIRSYAEPKGIAAMFGKTRAQESEGEVTAEGLRPSEFRDQREGRAQETATFDWPGARVVFSGGRGEGRLALGTQDMVSVFYQLAWLAPRRNVEIPVTTASRVGRGTFEWIGEEELTLSVGTLTTLHLRTRVEGDTTEVWLAPVHGGLPVKIRYVDRKGDVFEQTADLLELN